MKIQDTETELVGDLQVAEEVAMGIHSTATGHIMKLLTNLYKSPSAAALREYSSNAWDSHTKAGQTKPIIITTPTALSPNLIIEDFGVGMDRDELKLYGQYGFSSKSGSNDENGGFGLGSKVGLALNDQYVVQAVKDGFENSVVIGLNSTSQPVIKFLNASPVKTTKPAGVKIMIPVKDSYAFSSIDMNDFFVGWAPKSVLLDGYYPRRSVHDLEHFTPIDGFGFLAKYSSGYERTSYSDSVSRGLALVGPVRYDIDWSEVSSMNDELARAYFNKLIVQLPIGSVDLVPSRESLRYTDRTKDALNAVVSELTSRGEATYIKQIDEAATFRDAHKIRQQAISQGFPGTYEYKGVSMNSPKYDRTLFETRYTDANVYSVTLPNGKLSYRIDRYGRDLADSSPYSYSLLRTALSRKEPVLVADTPVDFDISQSQARHSGAKISSYLTRALVAEKYVDSTEPEALDVSYVSIPLASLDEALKGAFSHVLSWDDAKALADAKKKAIASDARKGISRVKKTVADTPIKMIHFGRYGASSEQQKSLGSIPADGKYIILDHGDIGRRFHRSIATRVGYNQNQDISGIAQKLVKAGYTFLTYNKSWNSSNYASVLTNLTPLEDAVKSTMSTLFAEFSTSDLEAISSYKTGGYDPTWARQFPAKKLTLITSENTRNWLKSIAGVRDLVNRFDSFEESYKKCKAVGFDMSGITYSLTPSSSDALSKYKMLGNMYINRDTDFQLIAEYINFIDSKV